MLQIHSYAKCSTCRDALAFLHERGLVPKVIPIREQPPTVAELQTMLRHLGGDRRKLFNTSGIDYRELGIKDQLPAMSDADAIDLLSKNGNLVKRPFVIGDGKALAGFKPETWRQSLVS